MKREWSIYRTLRALARQRVAVVLQPGGVWVIERAPTESEAPEENLHTCVIRGWIEPLHEAVPAGKLKEDGALPSGQMFTGQKTVYRLTDSGWSAIHRSHVMVLLGLIAALLGVIATIR